MKVISESDLFTQIANRIGGLYRRGRTIHAVEVSRLEFHELHTDGHIRVFKDRGRETYKIYIPELRLEVPVIIN